MLLKIHVQESAPSRAAAWHAACHQRALCSPKAATHPSVKHPSLCSATSPSHLHLLCSQGSPHTSPFPRICLPVGCFLLIFCLPPAHRGPGAVAADGEMTDLDGDDCATARRAQTKLPARSSQHVRLPPDSLSPSPSDLLRRTTRRLAFYSIAQKWIFKNIFQVCSLKKIRLGLEGDFQFSFQNMESSELSTQAGRG